MKIYIERTKKTKNIKYAGTAKNLLKELKINEEEVLVVCNDKLVSLDTKIKDSDSIRILSVISGG